MAWVLLVLRFGNIYTHAAQYNTTNTRRDGKTEKDKQRAHGRTNRLTQTAKYILTPPVMYSQQLSVLH